MRLYCICFLVVCLTAACSPVRVKTDVNPTMDFSGMKSFDWLETAEPAGGDVRVNNPELAILVRAAVESHFQAKGYVKDSNADFLVNWLGAIEGKVQAESIQHFYSGYGYGTLAGNTALNGREGAAVSYEEGTIVIDILDPQKHIVLWRGTGTRRLMKGMDEAQVVRYINLSVDEILKSFPMTVK